MKTINLTRGYKTIIDDVDFEKVSNHKWHVFGTHKYAGRDIVVDGKSKKLLLHRFIMNPKDGMEVDHINGDKLDNRRSNLRIATHRQNCSNHPGYGEYKGVHEVKNRPLKKRFCTRIMVDGKNLYIGYFKTLEEAKAAYDSAAMTLYGEFARTNFEY